jgi:hypothetical protein
MSSLGHLVGMFIMLLFVIGCAVSLFFFTMQKESSTTLAADFKNYSSVASFNNVQNKTLIPQDYTNFDRWGSVPGEYGSTSNVDVHISTYNSSISQPNVTWTAD